MNGRAFTRRRLIQLAGASVVVGISGCLTSDDGGSSDADGYAPQSPDPTATTNESMSANSNEGSSTTPVDESSFKTLPTESGVSVPLVPIDIAYDWYRKQEARFADARSETGYEKSHIDGAVFSPAEDGQANNDPIENWPKSDRIITYCACPHHLSSLRAASLINEGYERVYALDEGYREWVNRNYPVAGSETNNQPEIRSIAGATDPKFGGESAWAFHRQSGQREATAIEGNGEYTLDLPFYDVTDDSLIEIETPEYTIEEPLGALTRGTVTPSGSLSVNGQ